MTTTSRKLYRSTEDRWLGGVCGGLAEYFGKDASLFRLVFAVGLVLGVGTFGVAYVLMWWLVPNRPATASV